MSKETKSALEEIYEDSQERTAQMFARSFKMVDETMKKPVKPWRRYLDAARKMLRRWHVSS